MKNKNGISLIVLVITIIIVIILAAAVVLTLSKNNPLESAKEARFKEDVRNFQHELDIMHSNNYMKNQNYDSNEVNVSGYDEMKQYIPDITKEYTDLLDIRKGKLVYILKANKTNNIKEKWSEDINIIYNPTWEDIIEDMRKTPDSYKHPDATGTGVGVGTNKEPVNMDLWTCAKRSDGTYQVGEYKGKVVDGKIEGCIPQYIYDPDEKIAKPVTALVTTFAYKYSILTQPVIPDTVTILDNNAFAGVNLKTINIPNGVKTLGYQCFSGAKIEEIVLPDSITTIGSYAFSNCKTLKNIKLSNNLNSIGFLSFSSCELLESIIIPSSVTNIDSGAFPSCNNLKDIYIRKPENSLKNAPWYASNAAIHWNYPE